MKDIKHLVVSAIKDGTVIDHIPAKDLFKVISILGLDHIENQVTFGSNLDSKKLGKKAIIKISGLFFRNEENCIGSSGG
jgi:aspartate carbamoyltransferase regulatory subunit